MDWTVFAIIAVLVGAFILWSRTGLVPVEKAREYLRNGGQVIDVRTPEEFRRGHLPKAINVPVNQLTDKIGKVVTSKQTPVLLHCASGARSEMAKRVLKKLGYENAVNLGSYGRAAKIVG